MSHHPLSVIVIPRESVTIVFNYVRDAMAGSVIRGMGEKLVSALRDITRWLS